MIKDNIGKVRERIAAVCSRIGRKPENITIVAISKARPVEEIKEVVESGICDIGENRVQEAFLKYHALQYAISGKLIRWHMVGHLQTNKVKDAVKIFDLIQSVDSLHLAQEIDKQAAKINKLQDVLVEIKTSPEENKSGMSPRAAVVVINEIVKLKNVKIKGLMTIAAVVDEAQKAREYFKELREFKEKIDSFHLESCDMRFLSMGMTDDYEVAIEEGSNMLRIGRGIFGE
ncbi:MAG: YggS family pyridoxal phosphate-dependent enzyme [Candidatus Omnitrophota bacterium]|jgi:pyridoxal phosphate enzyme (YggS family)